MKPYIKYWALIVAVCVAGVFFLWWAFRSSVVIDAAGASWYAAAEQLDPIFALDGTDPTALRTSVQSFLSQRDSIASEYDASEASEIKNSLYPEAFLILLPDLQAARDNLLSNPTGAHAKTYHVLLIQTIDAYEGGAKKLAAALRGPATFGHTVGFMGGLTSSAYIASMIDTVATVAEAQKTKENARYACAEHYATASCETLQALSDARAAKVGADASAAALPAPDAGVKAADALIQSIQDAHYVPNFSPLVALTTSCFPYPVTYMRSWQYTASDGRQAEKSYVANDAYFWDHVRMASSTLSDVSLYKTELSMGSVFEYQDIANYYMCPDPGQYSFDLERILSMRELAQSATTSEAEHLLALPVLSKRDAAQYVLSDGSGAAFERYLEGSAHFDETVEELIEANRFIFTEKSAGAAVQFAYLYTARSYASILFFLDNPTFVPQAPSLFSQVGGAPPDANLRSWRIDLSKVMSQSEILAAAKKAFEVANALTPH